ncbi:hypothetical protein BUALT_Bualt10G0036400 [Buddleja alternifolia]|uniref:Reverse transcriptase n=1 Tax=Buddleja alternifolia TaxID=168488 RepID=A0AAV6WV09_9LAMI|nr:hypothetical protein BUALT_Bualt10G0036400 [Buddleja alternifolia]
MASSNSSCGSSASSAVHITPTSPPLFFYFGAITSPIPEFNQQFNIQDFSSLVDKIEGPKESKAIVPYVSEPEHLSIHGTPNDNLSPPLTTRFANVVSSPYLYKGRFMNELPLLDQQIPSSSPNQGFLHAQSPDKHRVPSIQSPASTTENVTTSKNSTLNVEEGEWKIATHHKNKNSDILPVVPADLVKEIQTEQPMDGLQANPSKSNIFVSAKARANENRLCEIYGFPKGNLPVRYLGVPLITSKLTHADCASLVDKVTTCIGSWTNKSLSYPGQVQLIKSVLSSLNIYWSGVFIMLKGVLRKIEQKIRRFLWFGFQESGYAKVSWQDICLPENEGALRLHSLIISNKALMTHHLWSGVSYDIHSIWVEWIHANRLRNKSIWTVKLVASSS